MSCTPEWTPGRVLASRFPEQCHRDVTQLAMRSVQQEAQALAALCSSVSADSGLSMLQGSSWW